jgi:hypothetical protein
MPPDHYDGGRRHLGVVDRDFDVIFVVGEQRQSSSAVDETGLKFTLLFGDRERRRRTRRTEI